MILDEFESIDKLLAEINRLKMGCELLEQIYNDMILKRKPSLITEDLIYKFFNTKK